MDENRNSFEPRRKKLIQRTGKKEDIRKISNASSSQSLLLIAETWSPLSGNGESARNILWILYRVVIHR